MSDRRLHFYTAIFERFDELKGAGLLTDGRIEEIKKWIAPESFVPAELKSGKVLSDWSLHEPTSTLWNDSSLKTHHCYDECLNKLLTDEEIDKLNKYACSIYSRKCEAERFERAEKIAAADYNGWVICGDDYYPSVSEYLDYIESENYDLGEEDEKVLPEEYVWACAGTPCCQINLDHIIENATDEAHEDYNGPMGVKELQKAVDEFNKLNEDDLSYTPDYKKAIIL